MTTRTQRITSVFTRPFRLGGVDRVLPAGSYEIVTEEELIDGLSFPVYRRVSTVIFVPGRSPSSIEMVAIDPLDLAAAQGEDAKLAAQGHDPEPGVARSIERHLVRQDERFRVEQLDGVYFSMTDGAAHVLCKVSHEALRDRSVRDGAGASLPDTFVRHRERIEKIAGEKYAQRHRPEDLVLVLSRDLVPLPM